MEIFNDRIEITNLGIPLVDIARIIDNPAKSRNEKLAILTFTKKRSTRYFPFVEQEQKIYRRSTAKKHNSPAIRLLFRWYGAKMSFVKRSGGTMNVQY